MGFRVSVFAAISLAISLSAFSCPVLAGPPQPKEDEAVKKDVARNYVIEGDEAFERGDYATALDRFERAERLVPAPTVLLRIGRTQVKLGRWLEAKGMFANAAKLDLPPDAPPPFYKAVIEANRELAALEPKIPSLQLSAPEKVAGVKVDGRPIPDDVAAKPMPINPGSYQITMDCCVAQQVTVKEGEHLTVTFALKPDPAVEREKLRKEEEARANVKPTNVRFIGGIASLGVGVLGLGVGVYGSVAALGIRDDFAPYKSRYTQDQELCGIAAGNAVDKPASGAPLSDAEKTSITDLCGQADTTRVLQLIAYPVGIIGVAAGVTLLLISRPSAKPSTSRIEVLPTLSATQQGLLIRGEF